MPRLVLYLPAAVTEEKKTPLHDDHVALGARMVPFAGYRMPVQYEGLVKEHQAVRERAGIFDVSHMGELHLKGEHAVAVVDYLVSNDVKKLPVGKALYTVCCNERGTIIDDLIIYKRGETDVLVVCNASNRDKISAHFARAAKDHCDFADESDDTSLLALQGPKAFEVLRAAGTDARVFDLPSFGLADAKVAGIAVNVARTGYTGEDGVELFCANADASRLFRALLEAGKPVGVAPAGLGCRDTLRLEARLSLYGNDIDETTDPLEAGLGWVVKLDKGDFVGRAALAKIKAEGTPRKLVGFEMRERGIARHGYPIVDSNGNDVGVVTSGSPSPTLDKNIGLGYVPSSMSAIGTGFGVRIRDKIAGAEIVKTPFYKRSA
jgi:aminomethyltransferase